MVLTTPHGWNAGQQLGTTLNATFDTAPMADDQTNPFTLAQHGCDDAA